MKWGLIPFLGQGPENRGPHDQRPRRDRCRKTQLSATPLRNAAASSSPTAITNGRRPQWARGHFA